MRLCFAIFPRTTSASGGEALRSCQPKPCMSSDLFERSKGALRGGVTVSLSDAGDGNWKVADARSIVGWSESPAGRRTCVQ